MKKKLKIVTTLFIAGICLIMPLFLFGCDQKTDSHLEEIESERVHADTVEREGSSSSAKIYISSLDIEECIKLSNNGIGVDFVVDFNPENSTEKIYIEIENKNVISFASDIPLRKREGLIDFSTAGNRLYPLSVGQSRIIVTAKSSEEKYITKTCNVIVEENNSPSLKILDKNGEEKIGDFKSSKKYDNSYEIYTAVLSSQTNFLSKNIEIISKNVQIIEESKKYSDDGFFFCFDFYIDTEGEFSIKTIIDESYANLKETTSNTLSFSAVNFVGSFYIQPFKIGASVLTSDEGDEIKYVLYHVDGENNSASADLDGKYTYYLLKSIFFESLDFRSGFTYSSENPLIAAIELCDDGVCVVAKSAGSVSISAEATDGSGQVASISIVVLDVEPSQLKVFKGDKSVDLLSEDFSSDLGGLMGNIKLYERNSIGKCFDFELKIFVDIFYVKENYAYFEVVQKEGLSLAFDKESHNSGEFRIFSFQAEETGEYAVNLLVNEEIVYTFNVEVIDSSNHFVFEEPEEDFSYVNYDFEKLLITVNFSPNADIILIFYCEVFSSDGISQNQNLTIDVDDPNYICCNSVGYKEIYMKILKTGTFYLTISDRISGLSVTFEVNVND